MLALGQRAFDQDMEGGWRGLARDPVCRTLAADLIRDYYEAQGLEASTLYGHEGQMRAEAGQSDAAILIRPRPPFRARYVGEPVAPIVLVARGLA